MVKAANFDSDSCLAAADGAGCGLLEPAFTAMQAASDGVVCEEVMAPAFEGLENG